MWGNQKISQSIVLFPTQTVMGCLNTITLLEWQVHTRLWFPKAGEIMYYVIIYVY